MRRSLSRAVLCVAAAASVAAGAAGCETTQLFQGDPDAQTPASDEWQESEPIAAPSFDVLWDNSRAVLETQGYAIDPDRTSYERREIVTRWRAILAPTRFEGYRRRAHVTFVPAGEKWVARASVLKQRNADIDAPSNPAEAQWERVDGSAMDATRTALLVYRLRAPFDPEMHPAETAVPGPR